MDLILWRHAEAEDLRPGLDDQGRQLTGRGKRQARDMAQWLQKHLPQGTRIIVSPAERTRQTADALKLECEYRADVGTSASASDILAAAGWPHTGGCVLVVGHQPTLGQVAARLMTGRESEWSIKKGGIWWFQLRDDRLVSSATLRAVRNPDMP